jgi:hypothetical protein
MSLIVLNSTNVVNSNNNRYTINFSGSKNFDGQEIALVNASLFYSNFNFTSAFQNNYFSYIWVDNTVNVVSIPDSYQDASSLNTLLQNVMVVNNHYLIDANGNNVYYLQIQENPNLYAIQLNSLVLPAVLGTLIYPAVHSWTVSVKTPQFIIPNTAITNNLGISPQTFPVSLLGTANSSLTSSFTPQITSVNSIFLCSDVADNAMSGNSNEIVYNINGSSVAFGNMISVSPNFSTWIKCKNMQSNKLTVYLIDQNYQPIVFRDNSMTFTIAVRKAKK